MSANPQIAPDQETLIQELQLARLILERQNWDIIASVRMLRHVMWEVFMQHFRWNLPRAAKASRVSRSYLYQMMDRAGVKIKSGIA